MTSEAAVVAWTGRLIDSWPDGFDDWTRTRSELWDGVRRADLLLLIDPPSFNYTLLAVRPGLPFVAVVPPGLSPETAVNLLGGPLVKWATAFDRVVVESAEVKEAFAARFDVPDEIWVVGMEPDWQSKVRATVDSLGPLADLAERKAAWFERCEAVADELRTGLHGDSEDDPVPWASRPLIALDGDASRYWNHHVSRLTTAGVTTLDVVLSPTPDDEFPLRSPDAVALVLPDGGQPPQERDARLRAAFGVLPPGGQLVIDAHVVDSPDGRANPTIGRLLEEIHEATGTAVHLESMASAPRRGQRYTRRVVLRFTSLKIERTPA